MKATISFLCFLSILTCCLIPSSCLTDSATQSDFQIKVDSIHSPDSVASNTQFDIEFFGTIGFDGCLSFKSFKKTYQNNDIIIEAWAGWDDSAGECPTVLVSLDGKKLNMTISLPGIYRLIIKEPGSTSLIKLITVH